MPIKCETEMKALRITIETDMARGRPLNLEAVKQLVSGALIHASIDGNKQSAFNATPSTPPQQELEKKLAEANKKIALLTSAASSANSQHAKNKSMPKLQRHMPKPQAMHG